MWCEFIQKEKNKKVACLIIYYMIHKIVPENIELYTVKTDLV